MKNTIQLLQFGLIGFVFTWLLTPHQVHAQTFSPKVTPTTGGYGVAGNANFSWTIGESMIHTASAGNYKFSQGFQQPEVQVLTNTISTQYCAGDAVSIPYSAYGIIGSNNVFHAELSDASGSFSSPVIIGSTTGNASGIINGTLPLYAAAGSTYRVRVVSSLPVFNGKKNPDNIALHTPFLANVSASALGCYTWNMSGASYSTTGTYIHHIPNITGCDSVYVLNLSVTPGIKLSPKLILGGPYVVSDNLMYDSLRVKNLIPSTEPYSASPFNKPQIGGPGGETVSAQVLATSGNNAIVDWIFLEIRDAFNPTMIVATKRALLQRDGDVVSATDGISPVFFTGLAPGSYYVSVKHRNHLGVMTANAIPVSACSTGGYDFTDATPVYTNPFIAFAPRKQVGSRYVLWPGDANNNKNIRYNGLSNDKDYIMAAIGGPGMLNTLVMNTYRMEDVNLDGIIRYNGTDNDRSVILNNVGVNTPNSILYQHVPN